jgi:hypothetical protein
MKTICLALISSLLIFSNCATTYKEIHPSSVRYVSIDENNGVKFEYKYNLLDKKYAKKEKKNGVKLISVRLTNNSDKDLMFGRDITLTYANGNKVYTLDNEQTFKLLKQKTAFYLLYLLLTPLHATTTVSNGNRTSSSKPIPIGLVVGPAVTAGNIIVASLANKKFKTELFNHDLSGAIIKKGETKHGIIAIRSYSFDALKIKLN